MDACDRRKPGASPREYRRGCEKAGRSADEIRLVAVSKTHPSESVREAHHAGQSLFGESRVQEARIKIPELPTSLEWHFIGHLQKNKIRHALPLSKCFTASTPLRSADIDRWPTRSAVARVFFSK